MPTRTFTELVQDLKQRRMVGDLPPVLLLGAGASVAAGIGAMTDLFAFVQCANFEQFCDFIKTRNEAERYRLLSQFLQSRQPEAVTPGYRALAKLCEENYFDLILTTNLDPLLDDALAAARLWRRDYLLLVNGVVRDDRLARLLTAQSPRVKVIKLHGDLFQRFMAWTPAEMDEYLSDIMPQLKAALHGRDMLVVGHSLRDERIRELALAADGVVWYTNLKEAPDVLAKEDRVRAVIGPQCAFELLFTGLTEGLGLPAARKSAAEISATSGGVNIGGVNVPVQGDVVGRDKISVGNVGAGAAVAAGRGASAHVVTIPTAQTVDDFMASIVALATPDGQPVLTGFVLAEPRVIVSDGYVENIKRLGTDSVTIITADHNRYKANVIRRVSSHPFGPLVLEVPAGLKVPGLRLDTSKLKYQMPIRVGVAAGQRVGISMGTIQTASELRLPIVPIGEVDHLITLDCVVAPGASGAPVVDDTFAVRGFIVAGATDKPPSFMLPVGQWVKALSEQPQPSSRRRQTRWGQ